jgi:hypothetical protein
MNYDFKPIRLIIALFLVVVLAQGCAQNLPAVREFSQATVSASGPFISIADDLPMSCIRRVDVAFRGEKVTITDDKVEYTKAYKNQLTTCDMIKESLDGIIEANNVLKGYAEALGQLASDNPVTFTSEIDALEANLQKIDVKGNKPFESPRAAAVSGLATFLTNAAANGYGQKKLKETINVAQPYLGRLVDGLTAVVGDYRSMLEDEKIQVEFDQTKLLRNLNNKNGEPGELNENLFQNKLLIESIEAKQKASDDYVKILKNIADTHTKLYESSSQLNSRQLIILIQNYVQELMPLLNNLRMAFNQ